MLYNTLRPRSENSCRKYTTPANRCQVCASLFHRKKPYAPMRAEKEESKVDLSPWSHNGSGAIDQEKERKGAERDSATPCETPMNAEQRVLRSGVYFPPLRVLFDARDARSFFATPGIPPGWLRDRGIGVGTRHQPEYGVTRGWNTLMMRHLTRGPRCGLMGVWSRPTAIPPQPRPNTGVRHG